MKPLLAHVYEPHRVTYPCYVQPKLNGIRALYQGGRFQSRDEIPFPVGLLDHLSRPLLEIFDASVVLDGELYVHGWPLQRINAAVTPVRNEPTEDTVKVEYHVFDVVDYGKSWHDRFWGAELNVFDWPKMVHPVSSVLVGTEAQANELYAQFVSSGYEGMMYRLGDCPYTMPKQTGCTFPLRNMPSGRTAFLSDKNNRCWHLLKRKSWQDEDFTITGVVEGEGRLAETLGAIICDNGHGLSFNVGSGFTDSERALYWNSHPLGRKAKVKFLCLSSDGIPLNPTLLAIL